MDVIRKGCSSVAGFAVTRSFAPARIEHELLAKVFEIVEHRVTICDEGARPATSPPSGLLEDATRYGSSEVPPDKPNSYEPLVREAVA